MSKRSLNNRLLKLELQTMEEMTDAELHAIAGEPPLWMQECSDDELRFVMKTGRMPYRLRHLESTETIRE